MCIISKSPELNKPKTKKTPDCIIQSGIFCSPFFYNLAKNPSSTRKYFTALLQNYFTVYNTLFTCYLEVIGTSCIFAQIDEFMVFS